MSALIDITGQRFGRLTVIAHAGSDKHKQSLWLCQCDCGNVVTLPKTNLRNGTKSCGCLWKERTCAQGEKHPAYLHGQSKRHLMKTWSIMIQRCTNRKNQKYKIYGGRGITVCQEWRNDFSTFMRWAMENGYQKGLCLCRLDTRGNYEPSNCAWCTKEVLYKTNSSQSPRTHGKSHTRIWDHWMNMKSRCYCKTNPAFRSYGGRGITVCEEWQNDFQSFYDWAMANGYQDNLFINRIDNDKGYSPDNCRWATQKQQIKNRRNFGGKNNG